LNQDLESEFKGTEIDVVVEEDDMSERKGKIIGNAASILAEELMKTEKVCLLARCLLWGKDKFYAAAYLYGIWQHYRFYIWSTHRIDIKCPNAVQLEASRCRVLYC
jgi:hypothetical protein